MKDRTPPVSLDPTHALTEQLIRCHSVTPTDAGCQSLLSARLVALDFTPESLSHQGVSNLWLRRGKTAPLICFAGHTDVVPPGQLDAWRSDPFHPTVRDGMLYGRGAADMKSSLAAFVTAIEAFVATHPDHPGSIAVLITSDEEGAAMHGTAHVVQHLAARGETIDFCIVGEPTSEQTLGDCIKNGRRGSLSGDLTVHGIQGHIAYPQRARNPIHLLAPLLAQWVETVWDAGNMHFLPTQWQASHLHAHTGATNITPASVQLLFNFRFSPETTAEELKARIQARLDQHPLDYTLQWQLSAQPFFTPPGPLSAALETAIVTECGITPKYATSGGTSDARFIRQICPQVVEFGPINATIHQVDECVAVADLAKLSRIYQQVLRVLLIGE